MKNAIQIQDPSVYVERMDKSILDKLFFLDKIETRSLIDFGCANGALLRKVRLFDDNIILIGYDKDPSLFSPHINDGSKIEYTSHWEDVLDNIPHIKNSSVLLSSIIHEIYHYSTPEQIDDFWNTIFKTGFEYIIIRDMVPNMSIDRKSPINSVKKIYNKFRGTQELTDFESIWGNIENNKQLVHFLLKYKYFIPNWAREVRENYLPLYREDLLAFIPKEYDVIFHEHYILPYLYNLINDELGIELQDATHLKLILKRNT